MMVDDAALRREFEEKHASLSAEDLARILRVDDPQSSFYQMPAELLNRTLEAVRNGYEDFIQERPEYPQYFTEEELEADLETFLEGVMVGSGCSPLDIEWSDVFHELGLRFPDEGDFSYTNYESVPYADGTTPMPVREFDEDGYSEELEYAVTEAWVQAPHAVSEVTHDFERDRAYLVISDAKWKKSPASQGEVESDCL